MKPYTCYFWKELTPEGIFIDAAWANKEGYEHSDEAICHFHYRFSVDPQAEKYATGPKFHLMKMYGLK